MLNKIDSLKAIVAIQDLIIKARNLAYQNYTHKELAELLDHIEYLPALIIETAERDELFDQYLEGICIQYNFPEVLTRFRK